MAEQQQHSRGERLYRQVSENKITSSSPLLRSRVKTACVTRSRLSEATLVDSAAFLNTNTEKNELVSVLFCFVSVSSKHVQVTEDHLIKYCEFLVTVKGVHLITRSMNVQVLVI